MRTQTTAAVLADVALHGIALAANLAPVSLLICAKAPT